MIVRSNHRLRFLILIAIFFAVKVGFGIWVVCTRAGRLH